MGEKWKKFKILYEALIKSRDKNEVNIWIAKPQTFSSQKINRFYISQKAKSIYREKEDEILYFEFKDKNCIYFKIGIETKLRNKKIVIKNQNNIKNNKLRKFSHYLKSEKFLEQTTKIKKLTHQITQKEEFILDKVIAITKFLKKNFKYAYPIKKRGVKNLNLNNLKGDCGEVGGLFVTMCRILNIPAKNNTGYIIYFNELNNIYEHGWTNIYLNKLGWIEIDPLARNITKKSGNYFYNQKNYLFTITQGFNIKLKPPIPRTHKTDYWNKLGLPLTSNYAQVLQPLIFSSNKKVRFEEKIKLIN